MEGTRLTVELLDPSSADDDALTAALTSLVNRVYSVGEAGLWQEGSRRTTQEELAGDIRAGELAVARLQRRIVGCIQVRLLEDGSVGEFGLLAADPDHRGIGVGRELVAYAERVNRERGARVLQLQLLVPTVWTHPVKRFLHDWYSRLGYAVVTRRPMGEAYPGLAPKLSTPCLLLTYQKPAEQPAPQAGSGAGGGAAELRGRFRRTSSADDGPIGR